MKFINRCFLFTIFPLPVFCHHSNGIGNSNRKVVETGVPCRGGEHCEGGDGGGEKSEGGDGGGEKSEGEEEETKEVAVER